VRDSFVLTNSVIALSLAVAGGLIAWHRPRNPVGWLLLAAAVFQAGTAAAAPMTATGDVESPLRPGSGLADLVAIYSWPWSIGLFLPMALLLFPDGTLPSRRWWPLVVVVAIGGLAFVASAGGELPGGLSTVGDILNGASYLAAVAALVVRYRRGDERRRRQLLWLLLALLTMLVMLLIWVPAADEGGQLVLILLVIPLVPAAITIAVLRHQLLDIRLVLSRAVLYGLLTGLVVAAYLGLVAVADVVLRREAGLGTSVLATLVIAIGFNPVRVRLQRVVDRALYGDRADPVRAVSRLGERLAGSSPVEALPLVREALRLPYAALRTGGIERGADGTPTDRQETVALNAGGARIGELVVGVRAGQHELGAADRAVLELLAVPLAMAVRATELSESLQSSRGAIVAAREEERRRLRRDLHDGLGPVLTGVTFQADAAGNLLRSDPDRAAELLAGLRRRTAEAIDDIRRLVNDLRPPALDELGLVDALRRQAEEISGPVRVAVDAPAALPPLPAAVEVAAYRIALEGLTNAVRHAGASHVDLRIEMNGALQVSVSDDGGNRAGWRPGVGLTSMRERAAELGGDVQVGPEPGGGRVVARLPL
jgi:signal transduction histidine kinase